MHSAKSLQKIHFHSFRQPDMQRPSKYLWNLQDDKNGVPNEADFNSFVSGNYGPILRVYPAASGTSSEDDRGIRRMEAGWRCGSK
jgi:hypothetical protein